MFIMQLLFELMKPTFHMAVVGVDVERTKRRTSSLHPESCLCFKHQKHFGYRVRKRFVVSVKCVL